MADQNIDGSNSLIIIGMHRSGTSLVASILHSAGLDVGKQLMSAHESINAKGFYENLDFVNFHEQVLESLGESRFGWTTKTGLPVPPEQARKVDELLARNARETAWGWKDPRTTLFLDYWAARLPKASFVFIHRPPWEVVDSLFRRGDQVFQDSPRLAVEIWTGYNQGILDFLSKNKNRGLLSGVQSVVDNPESFIQKLNERFGLGLRNPASDIFDEKLIDRSSSETRQAQVIQKFFPECARVYRKLLLQSESFGQSEKQLPDATISDAELCEFILEEWAATKTAQRELKSCNKTLYDVRGQLYHAREKLEALERSRVWKLRNIVHRLKQK